MTTDRSEKHRAGTLEIVATAISVLLVAIIVGVLVWDAVHPNTSPSFTAVPGTLTEDGSLYRVPVTIENSGDDAAKAVDVHLELLAADSVLAESDLTVDWVPGKTRKELVSYFARPTSGPPPSGVRAEVRGYVVP